MTLTTRLVILPSLDEASVLLGLLSDLPRDSILCAPLADGGVRFTRPKGRGFRMLNVRSLALVAVALVASQAQADLASPVRSAGNSFVVRQGYQQLGVYGSHADCEADALRRTANAGAVRRAFSIRSGSGAVLSPSATLAECLTDTAARLTADGARRPTPPKRTESNVNSCVAMTSYSTAFQPPTCVATHNFIATYVAPTTPTPPPVCSVTPTTEVRACPSGTSGTWSQTSTVSAYPECAVTWAPATPPTDRCLPIAVPTAPTVTLSVQSLTVSLAWSGAVPNQSYGVEKCRGSGCVNFAALSCGAAPSYLDTLPAGATARYRVRGFADPNCGGAQGPFSAPQQVTVGGAPAPIGTAELSWTPGAINEAGPIAGYYVVYGNSQNLDRQVIVPNAGVTTYTVTGLAAGTWYFAVKQYTANFAQVSDLSVIRTKTVR